ncbi:hypothetical protein BDP81DRAFT_425557 [Colletotrichum phormii]|uniref:SMP-30/Gluconolactonase/LRE-like region domain-containing protein n=1 Tax=Colletotrichum phormii TaxID=359342 RepID=A0AAI9ZVH2_9PEZI|nr:uncharacterized protein BDP81DRAFT_425557 [Colletotrichum phormii]KAK1637604.1 hypothetical protein BDP81DRAFT_425557 [Colletotrichum phormii]
MIPFPSSHSDFAIFRPKRQTIEANMRAFIATSILYIALAIGQSLPSRIVYQFPQQPNWIENIAVRKNGNLVLTMLTSPEIFQVAKPWEKSPSTDLVHRFSGFDGLLGITETCPDTFVVVGGNFSGIGVSVPGSFSAWEVNVADKKTTVNKIVNVPEAAFLNGVVALPWDRNIVLIAESALGKVYRLDVKAKKYDVVLGGQYLEPTAEAVPPIGVNGVQIRGDFLYWSHSSLRKVFRVKLDRAGRVAAKTTIDQITNVNTTAIFLDDFTFDKKGGIWAVTNIDGKLLYVTPEGKSTVAAGSETELTVAGDTAAAFGRNIKDKGILYVGTGGSLARPVNGTITEPGKIVAFDTHGYGR